MVAATGASALGKGMRRLTQLSLVPKSARSWRPTSASLTASSPSSSSTSATPPPHRAAALTDQGVELLDYLVHSLHAVITATPVVNGGAA
jgi:ATP-dependent RNA helicase DHX8/PRP22